MKVQVITLFTMLFSLIFNAYAGMSEAQKAFDTQDFETALKEAQPLAEQGNAEAQILMGSIYSHGLVGNTVLGGPSGVPQSWKKAVYWYRKAADQNYAPALDRLGTLYLLGWGVPRNIKIAAELERKAADQNYAPAQFSLGEFYSSGTGVKKDLIKSLELINKAADQNNIDAINYLGLKYEIGEGRNGGVNIDLEKAKELYQKAADLGDTNAQSALQRIERELAKKKYKDNKTLVARTASAEDLNKKCADYAQAYEIAAAFRDDGVDNHIAYSQVKQITASYPDIDTKTILNNVYFNRDFVNARGQELLMQIYQLCVGQIKPMKPLK